MNLPEKVKKLVIREGLIKKNDKVLLAISGGIDSVTLFHILKEFHKEIPFELGLAHVNHGLRGDESDRDELFVKSISDTSGIPLFIKRVNVREYMRAKGTSLQHAARDLRYQSLFSIAETHNYNKIAVAHTLDDQIETFFLRILKGTGIHGISSIPIKRGPVIRPLLLTSREEIEIYCRDKKIDYVEDSSNRVTTYQRNYLRHFVIPHFYKINPKFQEKVINLLSDFTNINKMFNERANKFLNDYCVMDDNSCVFNVEDLRSIENEIRFRIFANIASKLIKNFIIQRNHIRLIERLIFSQKPSISVRLPSGIIVKRVYDKIVFEKANEGPVLQKTFELKEGINEIPELNLRVQIKKFIRTPEFTPYTQNTRLAYVDGRKVTKLTLRTFRDGDRFVPLGLGSPIKLKDFFIKKKIPKDLRRRIPLIVSGNDIVWVLGMRIDDRFKVTDETDLILSLEASPSD
ncbi:MAG: tRNA lysidine(34) synthetase TilS [Deltaproteobacteria bacterium]|nr:tRNA lysidine(34) synthetase TilS [Deltaproteobacteria bacterium]